MDKIIICIVKCVEMEYLCLNLIFAGDNLNISMLFCELKNKKKKRLVGTHAIANSVYTIEALVFLLLLYPTMTCGSRGI